MNYEYFRSWTPEMSYYLGWLWADGNICDNKLQIGCCTEDEELVLGFMKAIDSHHAIQRLPGYFHKKGYYVKPYTKASIYGKGLINDLILKHGLLPRKTFLNPEFPNIKEEYLSHFIRGYFDGDGCISLKKSHTSVGLIGTKKFIRGLQNFMIKQIGLPNHKIYRNKKTKTKTAAWTVTWNKKIEVLKIFNFMYSGEPFLKKKKDLFNKIYPELINYCEKFGISNNNGRIRLRFFNKRLGEYKTIDECIWARNYAYFIIEGYLYPIPSPDISPLRQTEIALLVERRLKGDKTHQKSIKTNYI